MKKPTRPLAAALSLVLAVTGCSTGPSPVASAPPAPAATPTPITAESPRVAGATISGVVTDAQNAPLPGVTVQLSGPVLPGSRTTVTSTQGRYRFLGLSGGSYEVKASLSGFKPETRQVFVLADRELTVSVTLALSNIVGDLVVTSETPVVAMDVGPRPAPAPMTEPAPVPRDSNDVKRQRAQNVGRDYRSVPIVNAKPFPDMFFKNFGVNPTIDTEEEPLSTFAVDVDTASYALARSYLGRGALPEADGVRVEEFVNSFKYRYAPPADDEAFAVHAEAFPSPNRKGYHVLHVGLQARAIDPADRKPANLVFTIDVSGSMATENRLGLVKKALRLLVDQLRPTDTVGIVVYGSNARVLLEPVSVEERGSILSTIDALKAEGSTNAQDGIEEGYRMAARHLRAGGSNRVVLCSDGVANNGITDADGIFDRVRKQAAKGITVSAVGFGMGNYNDVLMERLAQVGHGNYAYVDRIEEARRIFVRELTGTLQVVAKDVKIQVELDKRSVARYRVLGYENRALTAEEFHDDTVDGGNVGAGHAVTALYEVKLRPGADRLGVVRIRYKTPDGSRSALLVRPLPRSIVRPTVESASSPSRLSLVAAAFAEKLRGSYWVRNLSYDELLALHDALAPRLKEREDVAELRTLIQTARSLDRRADRFERASPVAEMDYDSVPVLQ